jgi:signal transduction histidine kinase
MPFLVQRIPELAGCLLAAIVFAATYFASEYNSEALMVTHTVEVQATLGRTESLMHEAESGQRGFLLSSSDEHLANYRRAAAQVPTELARVRELIADNPAQLAEFATLEAAVAQRLMILARTVDAHLSQNAAGVQQAITIGKGREAMVLVTNSLRKMAATEQALLNERRQAATSWRSYLVAAIGAALLILVIAIVYWITVSRHDRRALEEINAKLVTTIAEKDASSEQVRQMQKSEAVAQLAAGVAHDFNNMLAVVISGINLAKRRLSKGAGGHEAMLDASLDGANRAAALVKRLLAFSRQQPLAPQSIDLNKLVLGMSEMITRSLGETIAVETVVGGGLWPTHVDPPQLENALLNLCINARDAMPEGGTLTIETANCHLDDDYSRQNAGIPAGQYVLLAVTDTGTGMTTEVLGKAFDPFFTTKAAGKGTGLGLSQVFGFVKQSGGHIKIYSEPGVGTTVKIYLPRDYAKSQSLAAEVGPLSDTGGSETILLVEDEARVLSLTSANLQDLGYSVIEASSPEDAMRVLQTSRKIDLLLTDIVMPGMNGRKLADAALALRPELQVVFMTGFTKNAVVHNGFVDPGVKLLTKPFTYNELASKIRAALDTPDA